MLLAAPNCQIFLLLLWFADQSISLQLKDHQGAAVDQPAVACCQVDPCAAYQPPCGYAVPTVAVPMTVQPQIVIASPGTVIAPAPLTAAPAPVVVVPPSPPPTPEAAEDDFVGTINNVKISVGGSVNIAAEHPEDPCEGCALYGAPDAPATLPVNDTPEEPQYTAPPTAPEPYTPSPTEATPTAIPEADGNASALSAAVAKLREAAAAVANAARQTALEPCSSDDLTTTTTDPNLRPCTAAGWSPPAKTTGEPTVLPSTTPVPPLSRSTCWKCPNGCVVSGVCYQLQANGEPATAEICQKDGGQWCTADDAAEALFATVMTEDLLAGSTTIQVASTEGFTVGDVVQLKGSQGQYEALTILGGGDSDERRPSVVTQTPNIYNYHAGDLVEVIMKGPKEPSPAPVPPTMPPTPPPEGATSPVTVTVAPSTVTVDCEQCSVDFAAGGGCAALNAGVFNIDYIPKGCEPCGQAATKYCAELDAWMASTTPEVHATPPPTPMTNVTTSMNDTNVSLLLNFEGPPAKQNCQVCASRFGAAGGCQAFIEGHDFGAFIPDNCGSCGRETMALCRAAVAALSRGQL